ncbi:hypothetical protein LIER_40915 [Lithospermum erythrorhizon]|uniref:Uncharacterized protein n=1 Tax=Lithospermum erythrorhizon TaxID=34254 RepID=A0AAV3R4H1_LITER
MLESVPIQESGNLEDESANDKDLELDDVKMNSVEEIQVNEEILGDSETPISESDPTRSGIAWDHMTPIVLLEVQRKRNAIIAKEFY